MGYLAYDVGRFLESIPNMEAMASGDEVALAVYDACVTYDMQTGQRWITAHNPDAGEDLIGKLTAETTPLTVSTMTDSPLRSDVPREVYNERVQRVQEWISKGDVYQVNISHRFDVHLSPSAHPTAIYNALRSRHSAPFGAYFDAGPIQLLSNSPECFLSADTSPQTRSAATWPLKGTRPRTTDPQELINDPKDRAEHVMIVDLERNDLGRVAVTGSVHVPALLDVVSYSTVHHLESRIEAQLRPGINVVDLLEACFPGGSITGAPKIRAMQIIAEIEEAPRGVYCGALGYISYGGTRSMWNIPIRTAQITDSTLAFHVGGGIVTDSKPDDEYDETLTKAAAFVDVLTNA